MTLAESLVGLSIFQTLLLNVWVSSYIPSSFFCSLTSFKFLQITTYPTCIQIVLVNDDDIKHYIWEFSIKECGAYFDLAESRFLWPFGCNLFGAFTTFTFLKKTQSSQCRKAKLRQSSGGCLALERCDLHPTHAASTAQPRLLLPSPSTVPHSSETPNFRFVADPPSKLFTFTRIPVK